MAAMGPDYSLFRDLPSDEGQVVLYEGKAALPVHTLGVSRFAKAFFLAPLAAGRSEEDEEEALFGRVIHPTPLGNWVYPGPLYFRASVSAAVAPSECLFVLRALSMMQVLNTFFV